MNIKIIRADITDLKVDAIVNAANTSLLGGGGVDGAIHRKGGKAILEDCIRIRNKQGGCNTGDAVITTAGNLPCRHVIHTVGPVWHGGNSKEAVLLASCYTKCLEIAIDNNLKTIAFPNISTGIYHFPKQAAAVIALNNIKNFKEAGFFEEIIFACFDSENYDIYKKLIDDQGIPSDQ